MLAQDVCNDEVGRVLTFSGTRVLDHANAVLEKVTKRMKDHPLARYAHLALGRPLMRDYKLLTLADGPTQEQLAAAADVGARIKIAKADQKVAREHLRAALAEDQDAAIATLGHEGFARQMTTYAAWLDETGDKKAAKACHDDMVKLLKAHRADEALVREVSAAKA